MTGDSGSWLDREVPQVPPAFRRWLGWNGDEAPSLDQQIEMGLERLRSPQEGAEHRGAFILLAADAWLTYAAREALDTEDPATVLLDMAKEVAMPHMVEETETVGDDA